MKFKILLKILNSEKRRNVVFSFSWTERTFANFNIGGHTQPENRKKAGTNLNEKKSRAKSGSEIKFFYLELFKIKTL